MSPKNTALLSIAWIILCLIRIGSRWDDLYWFFVTISSSDPRSLGVIKGDLVWSASDASLWFIGLIIWSISLSYALFKLTSKHAD
ncbi:hypothetical protein [Persicirhabdus sediminis]|uniref:Uncharacterized protein n=1 Tax=Persicirhabdus sediminis TaxID=454144 RepID=A0A8J7MBF2_9BACT|nr:hypothetical protein [Persicirhabdus sediminis]MBK1789906.1 hypothetical protein [Persicirhabdus sediminis]